MSDILEKILTTKRDEVAALKAKSKPSDLLTRCADLPPTRGFRAALLPSLPPAPSLPITGREGEIQRGFSIPPNPLPLLGGGGEERDERSRGRAMSAVALIAEVKKASPSKGLIRPDFDPVAIAKAYATGGASCLSVLTDRDYFQGDLGYLAAIREVVSLPLLRKDFLIDPIQIYEARLAGADAILLIVAAIPSPARLAELRHAAEQLGMDVLVEVHNEAELALAVESGATLLGVNNRDLNTFTVQLETFERLAPLFPQNAVAVAESGIFTAEDVRRMGAAGAHAVLVGESLMRQPDVEAATRDLLA
ncbi:indole-3-glycerol phosphate synthase TrpC [Armatimonas sp.]|uniref:indole-3-glycerol phosphate synthase TrpC n=1 Tax=Armatimonas sp. TaxID=1872638 RepID=UPI00286AF518|nr:indole-3-glycerol phosphate synthase TrpC [Armatimonas sp.]